MRAATQRVPVRVHRTALMLHALPDEYVRRPSRRVPRRHGASARCPRFAAASWPARVDVFCDPVAFSVEECRRVLTCARELGFELRLHADQFERTGGAQLAAEARRALRRSSRVTRPPTTGRRWRQRAPSACCCRPPRSRCGQRLPDAAMLRRERRALGDRDRFQSRHRARRNRCWNAPRSPRACAASAPRRRCARSPGTPRARCGTESRGRPPDAGAWGDAVSWECETLEELPYWMPAVRPDCVFMRGADLALPTVERRVWP